MPINVKILQHADCCTRFASLISVVNSPNSPIQRIESDFHRTSVSRKVRMLFASLRFYLDQKRECWERVSTGKSNFKFGKMSKNSLPDWCGWGERFGRECLLNSVHVEPHERA